MLGCTRSVWEAVHTWKIKNKAGEWVRAVEAYELQQQRELQARPCACTGTCAHTLRGCRATNTHSTQHATRPQHATHTHVMCTPLPMHNVYTRASIYAQHLFHSFLAALITYFDCVRGGRARHTVGWHMQEQAHLFCTLREQRAIVDSHISQARTAHAWYAWWHVHGTRVARAWHAAWQHCLAHCMDGATSTSPCHHISRPHLPATSPGHHISRPSPR